MSSTHPGSIDFLRRLLMVLAGIGVALVICVAASCGPTGQEQYDQRLAQTGKPAMHAVQSDRLKDLMGKLTYSMSLDPPDRFTEPARRAQQVAEVANQMASTARNVVDAEKEFKLSESDRVVFLGLAEKLRASAVDIRESASRQDYEGTQSAISRMQSTCNACHSLFRMMPAK
jgi:hypothetical protein